MIKFFAGTGIFFVGMCFLGFGLNQFCWAVIGAVTFAVLKD